MDAETVQFITLISLAHLAKFPFLQSGESGGIHFGEMWEVKQSVVEAGETKLD